MIGIARLRSFFRKTFFAGAGAFALVVISACGSEPSDSEGPVVLISPPWANGQANVAVAAYVLEHELGYEVKIKSLVDDEAWKALDSGKADAMLEDWDHPGQRAKYAYQRETVVPAGPLGITGRIGWFVPRYLANADRDVTKWENLNDKVELFASRKGDGKDDDGEGATTDGPADTSVQNDNDDAKGVLLQGDPAYKSHDQALIDNLKLNYRLEYLGSEKAQIDYMREAARSEKPFLTYFWTPHWIESDVELAEVRLPVHYEGCEAELHKVACGYPETELQKFSNAEFDRDGGKAAAFVRNFEWSVEEQNKVARMIEGQGMSPQSAAKKWVKENEDIWSRWLWDLDEG